MIELGCYDWTDFQFAYDLQPFAEWCNENSLVYTGWKKTLTFQRHFFFWKMKHGLLCQAKLVGGCDMLCFGAVVLQKMFIMLLFQRAAQHLIMHRLFLNDASYLHRAPSSTMGMWFSKHTETKPLWSKTWGHVSLLCFQTPVSNKNSFVIFKN